MKLFQSLFLLLVSASLNAQIITTVAGNGTFGYSGDGGPATNAQLNDMYYCYPAFDHLGNMYIAQTSSNTIRKIDASGVITTIAGTKDVYGFTGDGGPAVNALLYHPNSMAVDNSNNLYFVDGYEHIRKITPAGIITTVSGTFATSCGVGDGGPLSAAQFRATSAITFDKNDNLYITDFGCGTIRKVSSATGIVTTIAGAAYSSGNYQFSGDGGPAIQAKLGYPCKVAVDNSGNVYIPDAANHRIRKVDISTGIITTIAGNGTNGYSGDGGPATSASLSYPGSVVIDNAGNLYIGDNVIYIRKIDPSGTITTFAGNGTAGYSGDGGPALQASIVMTENRISMDYNNNIYFCNYQQGFAVRKISICNSATVTHDPDDVTVCNTGNAAFTITAQDNTNYQWQVFTGSGSWSDITDNGTYSGTATGTLNINGLASGMNNYQYRCAAINGCGPIYSKAAVLTVNTAVTPSVSIVVSPGTICENSPVTFTAVPTNGGSAPVYYWKKNGADVGTNSITYNDNALVDGDNITCQIESNATCLTAIGALAHAGPITVTPNVAPTVSISPSANNICSGSQVTFTSSTTNAGIAPTYTWSKNGINLPLNSPTYTDNSPKNGDMYTCAIKSSLACITSQQVSSLPITMTVNPLLAPSVTIAAAPNGACKNTPVLFTATPVNGGTSPSFQWQKNGVAVGNNSTTYTASNLVNGDIISCMLTSNGTCLTSSTATGNPVSAIVYPDPVVRLDKTSYLCEGSTRTLDAGVFSSYQWNNGSTQRTINITSIGTYSVTVTDNKGCTGSDQVNIATLAPTPKGFLPADTSICSFGSIELRPTSFFKNYLWNTGSFNSSIQVTQPGKYSLLATNNQGCSGSDTIQVFPKDCITGFFMPSAFSPNHDRKNETIKPILMGIVKKYQFQIYNRWGQLVFSSTEPSQGWDGTIKGTVQDENTFAWTCSYQLEGETQQFRKGTFILVR